MLLNLKQKIKECGSQNWWRLVIQIFLLVLIVAGITLLFTQDKWLPKVVDHVLLNYPKTLEVIFGPAKISVDYKNLEYSVAGQKIRFEDGVSETRSVPGSEGKTITKYFGNELFTDLNDDDMVDVVFLITQNTGGSGTFYYAVAAVSSENGYVGSSAVLIGDRISPQTTEQGLGKIVVINYADRKPMESFATAPSVGKSLWLLLDTKTLQFGELIQNFEGEADPGRMTLDMKTWNWIKTVSVDGSEFIPKQSEKFTLTFSNEGRFSLGTDCNGAGGNYVTVGHQITFSSIVSTLKACFNSEEEYFTPLFERVESYQFTSKGELFLNLKSKAGTMIFR